MTAGLIELLRLYVDDLDAAGAELEAGIGEALPEGGDDPPGVLAAGHAGRFGAHAFNGALGGEPAVLCFQRLEIDVAGITQRQHAGEFLGNVEVRGVEGVGASCVEQQGAV